MKSKAWCESILSKVGYSNSIAFAISQIVYTILCTCKFICKFYPKLDFRVNVRVNYIVQFYSVSQIVQLLAFVYINVQISKSYQGGHTQTMNIQHFLKTITLYQSFQNLFLTVSVIFTSLPIKLNIEICLHHFLVRNFSSEPTSETLQLFHCNFVLHCDFLPFQSALFPFY